MSRLHPFDVLAAALSETWFWEIGAAEDQGRGPAGRLGFHELAAVQRVLQELQPPEARGPGTTVVEYETLLYAAYRFWRAGRHTLAPAREALVGDAPSNRPPAVPHGACYLQLPERVFWAKIDEAAAPEPLDGIFVALAPGDREVTVLAVLGLRPDRAGFSQIAITVPPADLSEAGALVRRPLFASVLEGGERAGVKSLVSEAELLHLTHLALAKVPR